MMVCDWSEIGQTTVRDVTVFTEYCTYLTFCETADKEVTKASNSSSFKNGRIKGNQIHEAV